MDVKLKKSALLYAILAFLYLILRVFMFKSEVPYDLLSLLTLVTAALLAIFILGDKKYSLILVCPGYVVSFLGYLYFTDAGYLKEYCIIGCVAAFLAFIGAGTLIDKMFHVKH